ncbi:MAG: hypothetical protein KUG78_09615 [Kangiellaceae bacterium]|nr:hypothetical protein [Kangiellaceae bacterium]
MKNLFAFAFVLLLSACADFSPLQLARGILGYVPPPEVTTIGEELQLEFERCEKIDKDRNCAQIAYDSVRTVKGLEARKVPEGVVIILQGDVKTPPPIKERGTDHPNDTIKEDDQ